MNTITKFSLSLVFSLSLFVIQVGEVFAASAWEKEPPVSGVTQSITLETDTITGVTIVSVDVIDNDQVLKSVRVSLEAAIAQGLVILNGDGKPNINHSALGKPIEIDPSSIVPTSEEDQHPVGSALATFFSDVEGLDYETIMTAHEQGAGFGVIAQTLWLTTKLEGDAEIFEMLIDAKQTGDFSAFILEDGSSPDNWGQLKKAILANDKKNNLGVVMSNSNNNGNGSGNNQGINGNGNGNGNNGGKDKEKGKDKDKGKKK